MDEMIKIIEEEMAKYIWPAPYQCYFDGANAWKCAFEHCVIVFYYNEAYRSVECSLLNPPGSNMRRGIASVLHANKLFEDIPTYLSGTFTKREYVSRFLEIIHSKLLFVVNGDFSWEPRMHEISDRLTNIYNILNAHNKFEVGMWKQLEKKVILEDPSWESDLKEYLGKNS